MTSFVLERVTLELAAFCVLFPHRREVAGDVTYETDHVAS
jgi:hypothetical protein